MAKRVIKKTAPSVPLPELVTSEVEFARRVGFTLFDFQTEASEKYRAGYSCLINAPTGSGKTLAAALPFFLERAERNDLRPGVLQLLWITPLRALAGDSRESLQTIARNVGLDTEVGLRTGDTSAAEKSRQQKRLPPVLVTTPESLHVMLSRQGSTEMFRNLAFVVVDEWHELLDSKRGVQTELALSRLRAIAPGLRVWGMSATIANLPQALDVLVPNGGPRAVIKSARTREYQIEALLPERLDRFPWSGHIGTLLADKVLDVIRRAGSTLVFTNTRAMAEIWYIKLLELEPELAGVIAVHHGSLDGDVRLWVEQNLHAGNLRCVVCTSSLDLGVDFKPVDVVVQIGSPKGIARFLQRAGRSGHSPDRKSVVYFVPTNALEVIEYEGLIAGVKRGYLEPRHPLEKPLDVLVQYVLTLAAGEGFIADQLFTEVRTSYAFRQLSVGEWQWILNFVVNGGQTLCEYNDYKKLTIENEIVTMRPGRFIQRHRMSIGTIVSETMLKVRIVRGKTLGSIEEGFAARLKVGDTFWLAGRCLEFVRLKENTVFVTRSTKNKGIVPSYDGGRMSLSSTFSELCRQVVSAHGTREPGRNMLLEPLIELQSRWSAVPKANELLVEVSRSKFGYHAFIYPFEGRAVHEGLSIIVAERLSRKQPQSFTVSMNDYGFEVVSDQPLDIDEAQLRVLLDPDKIEEDILRAVNSSELARRRFREIARIACLTFQGFPSQKKSDRQLLVSAQLLFDVFQKYEPSNLLVDQSFRETLREQLQADRLVTTLDRIAAGPILLTHPPRFTPFAFPLVVDRLREQVTSERLEDRIRKLTLDLEQYADGGKN